MDGMREYIFLWVLYLCLKHAHCFIRNSQIDINIVHILSH